MPTYDGTILDTGGAVFNVRSSAFGAVGDGVADDTAEIQAAVNAAAAVRGAVLIPPGTYKVTSITLAPGITISGYGATLNRPNSAGNWLRMLTIPESGAGSWTGSTDSELLTIEGLTLDGNSANQGTYQGHELQQSHLVFLTADAANAGSNAGRVRANLRDLVLRNSTGDGISLYVNVDAQVTNCRADNCFRGGLCVTGGHTRVQAQNFMTTGSVDVTGIDVEVDGPGFGGSFAVELEFKGMLLDGDFDVAIHSGSRMVASNIMAGLGFHLECKDSSVLISNSRFKTGTFGAHNIIWPNDVTFRDCVFEVAGASEAGGVDAAAAHIYWNTGGTAIEQNQRCRFLDCDFRVAAGVSSSLTLVGIHCEYDLPELDNRLIVEGGSISSGFDVGMVMAQGGRWIVKETEIEAATGFDWNALVNQWGNYTADLRLERVVFRGATKYMHVANAVSDNVVDHRDVVLESAHNVLTSSYGLTATWRGGRIIRVVADPTGTSTPGLVGDIARLATPVAGTSYQWVCTAGSTTAATWKLATTLAA